MPVTYFQRLRLSPGEEKHMQITTRVSAGLLAAALCALPAAAVDMHCVDRDGRCMAVTINGQKAVKLDKATKKLLAGVKGSILLRHHVRRRLDRRRGAADARERSREQAPAARSLLARRFVERRLELGPHDAVRAGGRVDV
jgi:hypothetical protein